MFTTIIILFVCFHILLAICRHFDRQGCKPRPITRRERKLDECEKYAVQDHLIEYLVGDASRHYCTASNLEKLKAVEEYAGGRTISYDGSRHRWGFADYDGSYGLIVDIDMTPKGAV